MNPAEFIAKWAESTLSERSASQQHFLDLCELVGHAKPAAADPTGESFTFERGATKRGGGDGWADVWKRGFFGWEYKGKHKNLDKAYDQLLTYREDLENPPLLVVSDMERIVIHTNFTATPTRVITLWLAEIGRPENLETLRNLFFAPERLRPGTTSQAITEEAASHFGDLAEALRGRGFDPHAAAHFLDRIVFCLFAEDVGLLPEGLFTSLLGKYKDKPERFTRSCRQLFAAMATGGDFGIETIRHFNGSLFDDDTVLELTPDELTPNPHGRPNSDVLVPWVNGKDITSRRRGMWIVDYGTGVEQLQASLYEGAYSYLIQEVREARAASRSTVGTWWQHERARPDMRQALAPVARFLATPRVAKHRLFVWMEAPTLPDCALIVFARSDDYFSGVLHSRFHEVWARAQGTQLRERESGFRYTPTSCFGTFPLPWPPGEEPWEEPRLQAVGAAAAKLNQLRETWLNPPEWVREEVLEFPGSVDGPWSRYLHDPDERGIGIVRYPRLVPRDPDAAAQLKKRTLTNLYNARPTWLQLAHQRLDQAVAQAYGLPPDLSDDQILQELLERNLAMSG